MELDLQFFAEDDDVLDLDAIRNEVDEEFSEEDEIEDNTEDESEDETEESEEESEEEPEEESEEEETQTSKDNQAFAKMRNEIKDKEQYEGFVKNLADHYGVKPDELMEKFDEQKVEQEAKDKGTNPEMLKRVRELEEKNKALEEKGSQEKFNADFEDTIKNYGLKDKDPTVDKTFQLIANKYMDGNGKPKINFSDAYYLANRDDIVQKKVDEIRQQELSDKKKRQEKTAVPSGTGDESKQDDWTVDSVTKHLKDKGFID